MILSVEKYLKENIDENAKIEKRDSKNEFSVFLNDKYNFYDMVILDRNCMLLEIMEDTLSIASIKKHLNQVSKISKRQVVVLYKKISRYRKKRLIENRIAFIVEDGQMYLPFVALDFIKTTDKVEIGAKKSGKFTAFGQLVFLYFLYNEHIVINATKLAEKMKVSKMTASRALNELYDLGLLKYENAGKTARIKNYRKINTADYFNKAHRYLKNPVIKTAFVDIVPENSFIAGLEALSVTTMLNPPMNKIRAISSNDFKHMDKESIRNIDIYDNENHIELQVWGYSPSTFSNNGYVDIVSLYASLKEEEDERVEQAFEELFRGEEWYTD